MTQQEREKLIEKIGVEATNEIEELRTEIAAIHKYFDLVKIYSTTGWELQKRMK